RSTTAGEEQHDRVRPLGRPAISLLPAVGGQLEADPGRVPRTRPAAQIVVEEPDRLIEHAWQVTGQGDIVLGVVLRRNTDLLEPEVLVVVGAHAQELMLRAGPFRCRVPVIKLAPLEVVPPPSD